MAYKPVKQYKKFKENPFVEKAIEDINIIKRTQVVRPSNRDEIQLIVKDGEVTGHTAFMRYIEVDEEKFAKVYLSQFSAFWDLSKSAIRVFGHIINTIKPNNDTFILRMEEALKDTGYKHKKDIISGISSLIEAGIIARSEYEFEFFINPLVVFNGNRITFAKTYVKKKKSLEDPNQKKLFSDEELNGLDSFQKEYTKA